MLIIFLAASAISSLEAMRNATEWGQWNDVFVNALLEDKPVKSWTDEEELVNYLKDTKGRILAVCRREEAVW